MSIISPQPPASLPMENTISIAQSLISKWRYNSVSALSPPTFLFLTNNQEAKDYIECVHQIRRFMDFCLSTHTESSNIALAQNLMQSAMQRLEMEFHHLLSINNEYFNVALTSSDESVDCDMLTNSFADDLKLIAHCMIKSGYGIECAHAYKSVRKQAVDEELINLGFLKLRTLKVHKGTSDEELEQRVRIWIHAMFLAVGKVLNNERTLCDHIFSNTSDALGESSFAETTTQGAINIFTTGEMVANTKGKSSTEHIFRLLEMHMAIQEAIPDIESIFSFESTSLVQQQALNLLAALQNSICVHLINFESAIKKHSTKTTVPGGGIHTLTYSTMDHIDRLSNYTPILSAIITDQPSPSTSMPDTFFDTTSTESQNSPISIRLARLILVLLCKLDKIAETYKDISLSYLFLSNNLHFILSKVRYNTNLLNQFGETWIITHRKIAKQYAFKYEYTAWNNVLNSISLRKFELAFEEAIGKQRKWILVDERLKEDLKASIGKRVVSAYKELSEASEGDEVGVGEIEMRIGELFGGGEGFSGSSSSTGSSAASTSSFEWSSPKRFFSGLGKKSRLSND